MREEEERKAPNFILIMTDQQRADHVGFGGNGVLRTPHIDSIADSGMVFDRAHVSHPICQPNRSTIITGTMPSVHGTRFNGIPLDPRSNTFVRVLRAAGYNTALVGKSHLQNIGNRPELIPRVVDQTKKGDALLLDETGWDSWELEQRYDDASAEHEVPEDFYGFDSVDLVIDHADYAGGHYRLWLREQGVDPAAMQGPDVALETAEEWWQVYKPKMSPDLYPTAYVGMRSQEFLERAAADGRPFFLQMSFADPHHPFAPPGHYWDLYDPRQIPLPETFDDPHERSVGHYKAWVANRGSQTGPMTPWSPTAQQYRRAAAAEYGAITMIDDQVGRLLATLDRLGLRENTYLVFTSDHGDMFGEHGIMLKSSIHYNGTTHVPLVLAGPGIGSGRSGSLVGSIDIAPTVLELADLPQYHGMQGHSLVPLLDDPTVRLRDRLLIEEDNKTPFSLTGRPLRMRTVLTDDARYTRYQGLDHGEFFDLSKDPNEMSNLFGLPSAADRQRELEEALLTAVMEAADEGRAPTAMA